MARNGSGTYSVPNSFTAGTSITASDHNENWADVGSEMSNSLALDGQSSMTGQFKSASGTVAAPGIAFGSDTDSGVYRIGADNIGIAVGGTKIVDISASGITVTGTFSPSGAFTVGDGTVSLPGVSFGSDTDTGLYRIGANNIGIAANGAKVVDISTTGVGITGTLTSSGAATITSGGLTVTAGGLTVTAGGLSVAAGSVSLPSAAYAAQSDMETPSSATLLVSPSQIKHHPLVPKAWGYVTNPGTPTLAASYGVTSVTDNGTGSTIVTLSTAMSSSNYAVVLSFGDSGTESFVFSSGFIINSSSTFTVTTYRANGTANANVLAIDRNFSFVVYGDQ